MIGDVPVTLEQLKTLSARGSVAFALRTIQRTRHLFDLPADVPDAAEHTNTVNNSLNLAIGYVQGVIAEDVPPPPDVCANVSEAATAASAHNAQVPAKTAWAAFHLAQSVHYAFSDKYAYAACAARDAWLAALEAADLSADEELLAALKSHGEEDFQAITGKGLGDFGTVGENFQLAELDGGNGQP